METLYDRDIYMVQTHGCPVIYRTLVIRAYTLSETSPSKHIPDTNRIITVMQLYRNPQTHLQPR